MNKQSFFIPVLLLLGLFSLGVFVGIGLMGDDDERIEVTDSVAMPMPVSSPQPSISSFTDSTVDAARVSESVPTATSFSQQLEDKVAELEARVFELEQMMASKSEEPGDNKPSMSELRISQMNNVQTTKSLLKSGISEAMATDIIRRRSEIELRKLELQDRASREAYLGTPRYRRELSEILSEHTTLREELGDDTYDQYLFANGQANRVRAISVMMSSAAEQAGMKDGDLIVSYAEHRVFEWNELKEATTEGVLGDYVNVDIVRDGQLMSLSIPRGPLGVRLGTARAAP